MQGFYTTNCRYMKGIYMEKTVEQLKTGLTTAFIDRSVYSGESYKPQLVLNNHKIGQKVLTALETELSNCDDFFISVAFITMSGITPLLQTLQELEADGVQGKIITTDYLGFSEPEALDKLNQFANIQLRIYCSEDRGFHTKAYIFRKRNEYRIIVGSSNLTSNALTQNEEWNTKLVSMDQGEYTGEIVRRFNELWQDKHTLPYTQIAGQYKQYYVTQKTLHENTNFADIAETEHGYITKLQPNLMQQEFVKNMQKLHQQGANRALLISATGTGKTYASAFAVREFNPRRVLFLVHREQIAKQAIKSYINVLGARTKDDMGLLSGNSKDAFDKRYVFGTMQTVSKTEIMLKFGPHAFDFIIIDEAHHSGANSYKKIIDYFQPKMLLGMTGTPDRTDGFDIYKLFDHNIAYEIRLQQALEENFLCPFHYFGITDAYVNDEKIEVEKWQEAMSVLTDENRVDFILQKINYYGYSGHRVKGLIFCSRNQEAAMLAELFCQHINPNTGKPYRSASIAGNNSQEERSILVKRLVDDTLPEDEQLDYIFSVDIFNEGIDIPEINQVIMLRPTESPIIFIQQLGRGLRKYKDKEYVVVLDFIGNYSKNFMIPIALSGDRSYNKDNIRRALMEGNRVMPGASTIHFDKIAKQRIFQSIDNSNMGEIRLIKENYQRLRNKLGRIPKLTDFDVYGEMDVTCIFHSKLGSYHNFLIKYEKEYTLKLNELESKYIEFISRKFAEGKRPHELELIDIMLAKESKPLTKLQKRLQIKYDIRFKKNTLVNITNIMMGNFATGSAKGTFADCVFLKKIKDGYEISETFYQCLKNEIFANMVSELVEFGLKRYNDCYVTEKSDRGFRLYQKYDYEDVCRILEWSQNIVPLNIGGYKYDADTNTYPVFINYDKAEDISDSIAYHDRFQNNAQLIAISKGKRNMESEDVRRFFDAKNNDTPVDLFVRKNKDDKEAKSFYYLGRMIAQKGENIVMESGSQAVEIFWNLETPVREDIYEYITSEVL